MVQLLIKAGGRDALLTDQTGAESLILGGEMYPQDIRPLNNLQMGL